jgi:hypothetical protein
MSLSVRQEQKKLSKLSDNAAIIGQHCWNSKIGESFMSMQQPPATRAGKSADIRGIPA